MYLYTLCIYDEVIDRAGKLRTEMAENTSSVSVSILVCVLVFCIYWKFPAVLPGNRMLNDILFNKNVR